MRATVRLLAVTALCAFLALIAVVDARPFTALASQVSSTPSSRCGGCFVQCIETEELAYRFCQTDACQAQAQANETACMNACRQVYAEEVAAAAVPKVVVPVKAAAVPAPTSSSHHTPARSVLECWKQCISAFDLAMRLCQDDACEQQAQATENSCEDACRNNNYKAVSVPPPSISPVSSSRTHARASPFPCYDACAHQHTVAVSSCNGNLGCIQYADSMLDLCESQCPEMKEKMMKRKMSVNINLRKVKHQQQKQH